MSHRLVDAEALSTSRSGVPRVDFHTVDDARPTVRLVFTSSVLRDGRPYQEAVVTFGGVLDFHWADFDQGILPANPSDTGFALLEILDSELIRAMAERDRNLRPPEKLPGGGTNWEKDVHHYRLIFDDHGKYDVVCHTIGVDFRPPGENN